jgi:1-deoxy-D-xylulose-5-phosphate synthase
VFALDRAGLVGEDGPTHHGIFDISYLGSIPNLVFMAPADERELQKMLVTALRHKGPTAIRYPRGAGVGCSLSDDGRTLPIGQGAVCREGADLTLLAVGSMVHQALATADLLAEQGIAATVINARFIKPLDEELILKYARLTGKIYTMEEHVLTNGFGSAVLNLLNEKGLSDAVVYRFGLPDAFIEHGSVAQLMKKYNLSPETMAEVIAGKQISARKGKRLVYLRTRR